jgi:hypothetical protein
MDLKRAKTGRPRLEDRARTIEARKPWLKLEMSRRTWYRRQAEKRKGGSNPGLFVGVRAGGPEWPAKASDWPQVAGPSDETVSRSLQQRADGRSRKGQRQ